jgi:lysyl-tRNA synthetase, class I
MSKDQQKKGGTPEEIPVAHWADHTAEDLIEKHPQKDLFVCASGISPSGMVHIGNFREVITVEFVVRALLDRGKKVRFIYSWDDYDAFRKVPKNLPNAELLEKNLRKPLARVPDPYGEYPSYAGRFEKIFEAEISQLGLRPEYIYQHSRYESGYYANGIREAYTREKDIAAILNRARTGDLAEEWSCVSIFCKSCNRDTTTVKGFVPPNVFSYFCKACKKEDTVDIEKEGHTKLLWRVDWPMRWAREGVDFEPGGKDHSSQGGSYDTGKEIIREIWKKEAPYYVQYDFVLAKGMGSKLSSSSGNLITVGEALEIYEPAVLRWIFASRKPNLDFSIAFDLDVMKSYDDFDRCERFAYGIEPGEDKKVSYERRIYEFASIERREKSSYGPLPAQFPFRHLCNVLQIQQGDLARAKNYYKDLIKTREDEERFNSRAARAWKWINTYAPEEFKFIVQHQPQHKSQYPALLKEVTTLLKSLPADFSNEEELATKTFDLMKKNSVEPKAFFQDTYKILVNKPNGPKLASFLIAIGPAQAAEILERAL